LLLLLAILSYNPIAAKERTQKVSINTAAGNSIYINGKKALPEKGKYLLPKTQNTHLITAKREGYLDATTCAVPYLANGYTYPNTFNIGLEMIPLPNKLDDAKNLRIEAVPIDLKNESNKIRIFSDYSKYLKKSEKKEAKKRSEFEDIEYDNSIFSQRLNGFLKEVGFIDTTDKVLQNGYLNNLITTVKITEYTYNRAPAHAYFEYGGMVYTELKAEWTLTDIYGDTIFSYETTMVSDKIGYGKNKSISETVKVSITNALTKGLIEFMQTPEVTTSLKDKSLIQKEASFSTIELGLGAKTVSSLSDAIKSSVTIKADDSHGSGFIVSNQGHIITNFHVIALAKNLKVVMNDKTEHAVEIVRISKIHDLALLRIAVQNSVPFIISNSKELEIAADIFAVGSPKAEDLSQSISKGIISGKRRTDQGFFLMQIDASVNSGNSGGAIVTKEGLVLGVVSAKLFGYGIEGIGFGIPAYEILDRLKIKL